MNLSTTVPPSRVALVTGANRGIGRRLALGLAAEGLSVAVLARRLGSLDGVVEELGALGVDTLAVEADVRSWAEVRAAVARANEVLGTVDLLVNNAGVVDDVEVPVWEADPDRWWDVVETDLRGPFHCVRAVVPGMVAAGGGRVVDLSSGAGASDREVYSAYCAAKAGLFRLSGAVHLAGAGHGLRSFEISPGVVRSDMTAAMAMHAGRTDWTPPEAVVDLVVATAGGSLDAWSGCFLRAGVDTPRSLAASVPSDPHARRLRVMPDGPDDPAAP